MATDSFSTLNTYGDEMVQFTDDRAFKVTIVGSLTETNSINIAEGDTISFLWDQTVSELISPTSTSNLTLQIDLSAALAPQFAWGTLPAGVTTSVVSADIHQVTGILSIGDLNQILTNASAELVDQEANFVYTTKVLYTPIGGSLTTYTTTNTCTVTQVYPEISVPATPWTGDAIEGLTKAITNEASVLDAETGTAATYTFTVSINSSRVSGIASSGSGGSATSATVGADLVRTITGTKTQVNSHLDSLVLTLTSTFGALLISYKCTNVLSGVISTGTSTGSVIELPAFLNVPSTIGYSKNTRSSDVFTTLAVNPDVDTYYGDSTYKVRLYVGGDHLTATLSGEAGLTAGELVTQANTGATGIQQVDTLPSWAVFTLSGNASFGGNETIYQDGTGATGYAVLPTSTATTVQVEVLSGTFNTSGNLRNGPSGTSKGVYPVSIVAGASTNTTLTLKSVTGTWNTTAANTITGSVSGAHSVYVSTINSTTTGDETNSENTDNIGWLQDETVRSTGDGRAYHMIEKTASIADLTTWLQSHINYVPIPNDTGSNTVSLKLYRTNGTLIKTTSEVTMTGSGTRSVVGAGTTTYERGNFTPSAIAITDDDRFFLKTDLLVVGAGGDGGSAIALSGQVPGPPAEPQTAGGGGGGAGEYTYITRAKFFNGFSGTHYKPTCADAGLFEAVLDGNASLVADEKITQHTSGASGYVKSSTTNSTSLQLYSVNGTFSTSTSDYLKQASGKVLGEQVITFDTSASLVAGDLVEQYTSGDVLLATATVVNTVSGTTATIKDMSIPFVIQSVGNGYMEAQGGSTRQMGPLLSYTNNASIISSITRQQGANINSESKITFRPSSSGADTTVIQANNGGDGANSVDATTGNNGVAGGCGGGGAGGNPNLGTATYGSGGALVNGLNNVTTYTGGATAEAASNGANALAPSAVGEQVRGGTGGGTTNGNANSISGSSLFYAYPGKGAFQTGTQPPTSNSFRLPGSAGHGSAGVGQYASSTSASDGIIVIKKYSF
jgi:hypothetical protein